MVRSSWTLLSVAVAFAIASAGQAQAQDTVADMHYKRAPLGGPMAALSMMGVTGGNSDNSSDGNSNGDQSTRPAVIDGSQVNPVNFKPPHNYPSVAAAGAADAAAKGHVERPSDTFDAGKQSQQTQAKRGLDEEMLQYGKRLLAPPVLGNSDKSMDSNYNSDQSMRGYTGDHSQRNGVNFGSFGTGTSTGGPSYNSGQLAGRDASSTESQESGMSAQKRLLAPPVLGNTDSSMGSNSNGDYSTRPVMIDGSQRNAVNFGSSDEGEPAGVFAGLANQGQGSGGQQQQQKQKRLLAPPVLGNTDSSSDGNSNGDSSVRPVSIDGSQRNGVNFGGGGSGYTAPSLFSGGAMSGGGQQQQQKRLLAPPVLGNTDSSSDGNSNGDSSVRPVSIDGSQRNGVNFGGSGGSGYTAPSLFSGGAMGGGSTTTATQKRDNAKVEEPLNRANETHDPAKMLDLSKAVQGGIQAGLNKTQKPEPPKPAAPTATGKAANAGACGNSSCGNSFDDSDNSGNVIQCYAPDDDPKKPKRGLESAAEKRGPAGCQSCICNCDCGARRRGLFEIPETLVARADASRRAVVSTPPSCSVVKHGSAMVYDGPKCKQAGQPAKVTKARRTQGAVTPEKGYFGRRATVTTPASCSVVKQGGQMVYAGPKCKQAGQKAVVQH